MSLVYQDMVTLQETNKATAAAQAVANRIAQGIQKPGKRQYEYDSDEDIDVWNW